LSPMAHRTSILLVILRLPSGKCLIRDTPTLPWSLSNRLSTARLTLAGVLPAPSAATVTWLTALTFRSPYPKSDRASLPAAFMPVGSTSPVSSSFLRLRLRSVASALTASTATGCTSGTSSPSPPSSSADTTR